VEFLRDLLLAVFLDSCLVLGVTRMGGAFVLLSLLAFASLVQTWYIINLLIYAKIVYFVSFLDCMNIIEIFMILYENSL